MAMRKVAFLSTLDSSRDRSAWLPVSFFNLAVFLASRTGA
jgi:hypothetical protein